MDFIIALTKLWQISSSLLANAKTLEQKAKKNKLTPEKPVSGPIFYSYFIETVR